MLRGLLFLRDKKKGNSFLALMRSALFFLWPQDIVDGKTEKTEALLTSFGCTASQVREFFTVWPRLYR